jgi:hypothetical protein
MKYLILLGAMLFGRSSNTLNVKDYGAVGNGISDDTNSVNSCFTAASSTGKSVYFPTGTYLCNVNDTNGYILKFTVSGKNNITVYGDGQGKSIITTSDTNATNAKGSTLLYVYSAITSTGLNFSNLTFQSTHGITQKQTTGIFFQGTNGQNLDTIGVYDVTFSGFGSTVGLQGVNGAFLKEDSFLAPRGHDCGQHGMANPVSFITGYDNANGLVNNLDVERNVAIGYTGPIPLNCPRPLDNFVYGTYYGTVIKTNPCKYFSQEIVSIAPQTTNPNTTTTNLIQDNYFDGSLPPGCVEDNGSAHKYNYLIRCDASNTYIVNNYLRNYTTGIMVYEVTYTTLSPSNFFIHDNKCFAAIDTATYTIPGNAITVQGYSGHPITNVNIYNNRQFLTDSTNISTGNLSSPTIYNNSYSKVVIP